MGLSFRTSLVHRVLIMSLILFMTFVSKGAWAQMVKGTPRVVERVRTNKPGVWSLGTKLRYESDRRFAENISEYDNFRVYNTGIRWGMTEYVEVGADINYSDYEMDDFGFGREGIESTNLQIKIPWHEYAATTIEAKFPGEDDVIPYGKDDVGFGINLPFKFPFAQGMFHGDVGMQFTDGNVSPALAVGGGTTTPAPDWDDYVTYGIGYVYDIHRLMSMSVELAGHTKTMTGGALNHEDYLELNIGSQLHLSPKTRLDPSVAFGLLEGSPDFAVGLGFETKFGEPAEQEDSMDDPEAADRFAHPAQPMERKQKSPSETSMEETDEMERKIEEQPTTESDPADRLIKEGRQAFRNGVLQKAIKKFEQAAEYAPQNLIVQSNLGSLYYRTGEYEKARKHYKKAIDIDSDDSFSHLYLGLTHYRLGDIRLARRHLRRVRQIDPGNEQAKQWLEKLNNQ